MRPSSWAGHSHGGVLTFDPRQSPGPAHHVAAGQVPAVLETQPCCSEARFPQPRLPQKHTRTYRFHACVAWLPCPALAPPASLSPAPGCTCAGAVSRDASHGDSVCFLLLLPQSPSPHALQTKVASEREGCLPSRRFKFIRTALAAAGNNPTQSEVPVSPGYEMRSACFICLFDEQWKCCLLFSLMALQARRTQASSTGYQGFNTDNIFPGR